MLVDIMDITDILSHSDITAKSDSDNLFKTLIKTRISYLINRFDRFFLNKKKTDNKIALYTQLHTTAQESKQNEIVI